MHHVSSSLRTPRVRASELVGRGWLNTGGRSLRLADLRGKIVLLDFWTFCCVNCLHVLDELRDLEREHADVLVTIGVHSPKFEHEADPQALADAVERYAVHHPVLDDPELVTWQAFAARAWPTLTVIDPEGYVVAQMSGEGHAHGLSVLLDELVAEHEAKGTLHRGDGPYVPPPPPDTALRFPGGVLTLPGGTVLVSDTTHHQLVELEADLVTERRRIGSGSRGLHDGAPEQAAFAEPQGLALLPPDVAAVHGVDVVVADSVNHAVRGVRLCDGRVSTLAGTGRQQRGRLRPDRPGAAGPARELDLSTPWDVAWWQDRVVVAMAGAHQLWTLDLTTGTVAAAAGTTDEGLRDGPAASAWFAQPSGLAVGPDPGSPDGPECPDGPSSPDGTVLWVADSETSSVRWVRPTPQGWQVGTAVGAGLFEFGHVDGPAGPEGPARLQHPLGVAVLPDGSVAVADTYNGALRRYDPVTVQVSTLADGLAEPSALVVDDAGREPVLVVVESAAHRLVRVLVPARARHVAGEARRTQRPVTDLASGPVRLDVGFVPPTGQKLDDRWGDPTRLSVSATPPELLVDGAGTATGLSRDLSLAADVDSGVLHVSVQAAACDGDPGTGEVPEHAACHLYQQDWGIPVRVVPGAGATLRLELRDL